MNAIILLIPFLNFIFHTSLFVKPFCYHRILQQLIELHSLSLKNNIIMIFNKS